MKVAFIVKFSANSYSGGRTHALNLAYAFARLGYNVDIYTNVIPVFLKDLPDDEAKGRIRFYANKLFLHKIRKHYVHIVIVPHLATKIPGFDPIVFYPFAKRIKTANKCLLWYLDFESPNWINETDPSIRDMSLYRYSNTILEDTDIILSTTKIGSEYAKQYYTKFNSKLYFHQLYATINSAIADKIGVVEKTNSIVVFGRFNQRHKNPSSLLNIIKAMPMGFDLLIIGNKNTIDNTFLEQITGEAKRKSIKMTFHPNVSDERKFMLLASARLLLFSSKFEGYGSPPIEAQYVGTPVLCTDLPVLRELNSLARFTDFDDIIRLGRDMTDILNNPPLSIDLHKSVASFAAYDMFSENLKQIIRLYEKRE
jgi:glycosyltransferase involved in cell wall biosynthesis